MLLDIPLLIDGNVKLPVFSLGDSGFVPAARAVFTPFGVLEKDLWHILITDYTPIKSASGYGKEQKTNVPITLTEQKKNCKILLY